MEINAYAAKTPKSALEPFKYEPKALGSHEVEIKITHCGVCHSDVHLVDGDWGTNFFPLVPGHEIIGTVNEVGSAVTTFQKGQRVGVGWQCGCCGECEFCKAGNEHLCPKQAPTCMGHFGGFADRVRAHQNFVFSIPSKLDSETTAPLLCGGVTVYSPLSRYVKSGMKVGIIGVGGLGHMAIKLAKAMNCEVSAFSHTADKEKEAKLFGAQHFVDTTDSEALKKAVSTLDFLLSTVPVNLDWNTYLSLLKSRGTLCIVGAIPGDISFKSESMVVTEKCVRGSMIGSPDKIRELLAFAEKHDIKAKIESNKLSECNEVMQRVREGKARYRIVLNM